jgi:hypothetical protein
LLFSRKAWIPGSRRVPRRPGYEVSSLSSTVLVVFSRDDLDQWPALDARYAPIWPKITVKKNPPTHADGWLYKTEKIAEFVASPASG